MNAFQSFFESSAYQMVDVSKKATTRRTAIACGEIHVGEQACALIRARELPKGDALLLAEMAGIQGAKQAYQHIPLCHPLALDTVNIRIDCDHPDTITVYCLAAASAKTGVEMEALAGVQAALLTIYDLTKMVEPALTLSNSRLLYKQGGKSGVWTHPDGLPQSLLNLLEHQTKPNLANIKTVVITISDRASQGVYENKSGAALKNALQGLGANIIGEHTVADTPDDIRTTIESYIQVHAPQLIITTGGTGISPRDITYKTCRQLCDEDIPGIAELLRADGAQYTKHAYLSRSYAGKLDNALLINLPGSPRAVSQAMQALESILPHALEILMGKGHA